MQGQTDTTSTHNKRRAARQCVHKHLEDVEIDHCHFQHKLGMFYARSRLSRKNEVRFGPITDEKLTMSKREADYAVSTVRYVLLYCF